MMPSMDIGPHDLDYNLHELIKLVLEMYTLVFSPGDVPGGE